MKIESGKNITAGKTATDRESDGIKEMGDFYEGRFAKMLLEEMRKTAETPNEDRLIPKSSAERIYEEMLDDEYAEKLGKMGHLGISKVIQEQYAKKKGI